MLSTFAFFLLLAAPQHPASQADISGIKKTYPGFVRNFNGKKWNLVGKAIAPDFVHETPTHEKIGKEAFLKERAVSLAPFQHMKFTGDFSDFTTSEAGTRLEVSWVMTAGLKDKQGKHAVRATGTEAHTWKKSHGKWLLEAIEEHQSSVTIDGKVVQVTPAPTK